MPGPVSTAGINEGDGAEILADAPAHLGVDLQDRGAAYGAVLVVDGTGALVAEAADGAAAAAKSRLGSGMSSRRSPTTVPRRRRPAAIHALSSSSAK